MIALCNLRSKVIQILIITIMVYTQRSFQIAVSNGIKFSSITEGKSGLLFCILAND